MNKITNLVLSILISFGMFTSVSAQWDKNQGFYLPDLGKNYQVPELGGGFYMPDLGGNLNAPAIDAGYYLPNLGQGFAAPNLGDGFYLPELGKGFNTPALGDGFLLPNVEGYQGDAFYFQDFGKGFDLPQIQDAYFLPDLGANFGKKDFGAGFFFPEQNKNVVIQGADGVDGADGKAIGGGFFMPDLGKGLDIPSFGEGFYFPDLTDKLGGFLVPDLGGKLDIPGINDGFAIPGVNEYINQKLVESLGGQPNVSAYIQEKLAESLGGEVGYFLPDLDFGQVGAPKIGDGLYIPQLGNLFCDKLSLGDGIILPDLGKNIGAPAFDNSIYFPDLGSGFNLPEIGGGYLLQDLAGKINIPDLKEGFYLPDFGKGLGMPEVSDGFYFPDLAPIFAGGLLNGGVVVGGNGEPGAPGESVVAPAKNIGGGFYAPDLGKGFNLPQIGGGYVVQDLGKKYNVPVNQGYYFPKLGRAFNNEDLGGGYYVEDLGRAIDKGEYGDGFYFPQVDKAYDYKVGDAFYFQDLGEGFGHPEIGGGFYAPELGEGYKGYNLGGGYQFPELAIRGAGKKAVDFPDLGEGYYFQDENAGYFFPIDEINNQAGKRGGGFKLPKLGAGYAVPQYQVPNFGGKKLALPQVKGGFQAPKIGGGFNLPQFGGGFNPPKIQNTVIQGQPGAPGQSNNVSLGGGFDFSGLGNLFGGNLFTQDKQFDFGNMFNMGNIFGGFDFSKFKNLLNFDLLGGAFEIPDFGKDIDLPQLGSGIFLPELGSAIDLPDLGGKFDIPNLKGFNIPDLKNFSFPDFDLGKFDKFGFNFANLCNEVPEMPMGSQQPVVSGNPIQIVENPGFDGGFLLGGLLDAFGPLNLAKGDKGLTLDGNGYVAVSGDKGISIGPDGSIALVSGDKNLNLPANAFGNLFFNQGRVSILDRNDQVVYERQCNGDCDGLVIDGIKEDYETIVFDVEQDNERARVTRRIVIEESSCSYTELAYPPQVNNIAANTALVSTSNLYNGVSLEIKESTSNEWVPVAVSANGAALLSQLKGCTKYDVRNAFTCESGKIASTAVTFETAGCENLCDGQTVGLNKLAAFGNGVVLNWDVLPGKAYQLKYKATDQNDWITYNTRNSIALLFGLDACSTYEFKVSVICDANVLSVESNTIAVETSNCRLGNDLAGEKAIAVYPTIAKDFIGIAAENVDNISEVNIHNLAGRMVKTINPQEMTTSVSDLPKGSYVVTAIAGDKVLSARFMKQ